jgi:hypothetical protein
MSPAPQTSKPRHRQAKPDYRSYEAAKSDLRRRGLTPAEYEAAVRRAARRAGI